MMIVTRLYWCITKNAVKDSLMKNLTKLYLCQLLVCHKALGMESGAISDGQISASSFEVEGDPARARLNFEVAPGKVGSWSSLVKDNKQWLQVDLGSRQRNVTVIATQGGTNYKKRERWVTRYKLQYSYDGVNFKYYKGQGETTDMVRWLPGADYLNDV